MRDAADQFSDRAQTATLGNFSILAIDIVTVRLLVPLTAVGVALIAADARATDTVQRMNGRPRHAGGAFCF